MIVHKEREARLPKPITLPKLLLVEGATPSHFFEALAMHLKLQHTIEIRDYLSVSELAVHLQTLASTSDFRNKVKSLGIARDAETDPNAAKSSVESAIASADLADITVTYCILPDLTSPGMLETLCMRSVASSPISSHVDEFLKRAQTDGAMVPIDHKREKNRAQAFLATFEDCQMFPGIAASRGHWPFDDPAFEDVRKFLLNL